MIAATVKKTENVPTGWAITELSKVVDINPESRDPTQNPDQKFSYIDIDSVENGSGVITAVKEITGKDAPSRARRVVRTDDVIMSEVRPYLKAFALVPKKLNNQICSTGFAVLRSKGVVDPKYLLNTLFSDAAIEQCYRMMVGAQYPALNDSQVKKIRIPFPPLPEQRRIAAILTTVDDAIQRSRKATAETERLKAGVMQELMTKGIGHTEFREDEGVGQVPKEWMISQLGKFAEIIMGQSPSGDTYNGERNGVPLINGPVEFGIDYPTPLQWTSAPTKICKKGDILFCVRGNTTARINIADQPYCIGRGIAAIRGTEGASITSFIKFALINRHDSIYQMAVGGGSTFPNITSKQLIELKLGLPSVKEQDRIATVLFTIDRKFSLQRQRTANYEHLKQGLMNELLTGKRRVMVT
jgi:type I restriction enzyme S subunit